MAWDWSAQGWKRDYHWVELGIVVFVGSGGLNAEMMLLYIALIRGEGGIEA